MSSWVEQALIGRPGFERELVERYTGRLLALARRQLPARVRRRVDPEDVVQSVYRSFFRRLRDGRFSFEDSHDVWRLLAAITFHKARKTVRYHQQERRDVRRESPPLDSDGGPLIAEPTPTPEDVATLFDSLDTLLGRLQPHHRDVVALRLQGHSIEEIARHVGRSQSTVLRVLARVRDLAAEELAEGP